MNFLQIWSVIILSLSHYASANDRKMVLMTEVFAFPIDPPMFNWTFEGIDDQYIYRPSLLNKPDLPPWIHYKYSKRHHTGFLYGVPQKFSTGVELEIIAQNQINFETRRHSFYVHVTEKLNPARHEVQLKIDNLNVEDMFDVRRMERLKDVFRHKLWRESEDDLYVTFLESAVHLGARVPLRPNEGEGVVIRLGSRAELSSELLELQEEVRPLWKLSSCPRDFKRTTVERVFREVGFALDWCSFRLLEDDSLTTFTTPSPMLDLPKAEQWLTPAKIDIPARNYSFELLFTSIISVLILIVLVWVLSMVLCFHHDGIQDEFFDSLFDQCINYYENRRRPRPSHGFSQNHRVELTTQRPTNRTPIIGKDYNLTDTIIRSRTNSPSGTLARTYCRPSPPPYPASNKQEL